MKYMENRNQLAERKVDEMYHERFAVVSDSRITSI